MRLLFVLHYDELPFGDMTFQFKSLFKWHTQSMRPYYFKMAFQKIYETCVADVMFDLIS